MEQMVSIRSVIGKVVGKLRLSDVSANITQFADWAVDAEMKIGSRNSYERVECELEIKDYRACLPKGFVSLIAIKSGNHILEVTMRDFRQFNKAVVIPKKMHERFCAGNLITQNPGQPNVHQVDFLPVFNPGDNIAITIVQDGCGNASANTFNYIVQPADTLTDIILEFVNQINSIPGFPYYAAQDSFFFQIIARNNLVNLQITTFTDSTTGSISHQLISRRILPTTGQTNCCDDNCAVVVKHGSENLANRHTALLNDGFLADTSSGTSVAPFGAGEGSPGVSKFSIDNGFIHFNAIENGKVGIAYYGVKLDKEGWPMIHSGHVDAVTQYLMWQYNYADFVDGKINQGVFQQLERRWYTLCAQARGDDELPDPAELIYLANQWMQLLPLPSHNFF